MQPTHFENSIKSVNITQCDMTRGVQDEQSLVKISKQKLMPMSSA